MAGTVSIQPALATHGADRLPKVLVDSYNVEVVDEEGFIGDRANKQAFRNIIERWRKPLRKLGQDPLGDEASDKISKKALDELLAGDDPEAAGIVHAAIEDFAQELAEVIRHFLELKLWHDTERIVIGGGLCDGQVGKLAVGRASVILKTDKIKVDVDLIRHRPSEAGLIGAVHLAPAWIFEGHDAILAVDIGGTNMRAGVVRLNLKKAADFSKADIWKFELWRHGDEKLNRDDAVQRLIQMLRRLVARAAKDDVLLAPFVGIGCPGRIEPDGSIDRGAQNLPGNWESSRFNLPSALHDAVPKIGAHETSILMHNDAVVQGLSQVPFMRKVERWGVFTIGTGFGNARFTNRKVE